MAAGKVRKESIRIRILLLGLGVGILCGVAIVQIAVTADFKYELKSYLADLEAHAMIADSEATSQILLMEAAIDGIELQYRSAGEAFLEPGPTSALRNYLFTMWPGAMILAAWDDGSTAFSWPESASPRNNLGGKQDWTGMSGDDTFPIIASSLQDGGERYVLLARRLRPLPSGRGRRLVVNVAFPVSILCNELMSVGYNHLKSELVLLDRYGRLYEHISPYPDRYVTESSLRSIADGAINGTGVILKDGNYVIVASSGKLPILTALVVSKDAISSEIRLKKQYHRDSVFLLAIVAALGVFAAWLVETRRLLRINTLNAQAGFVRKKKQEFFDAIRDAYESGLMPVEFLESYRYLLYSNVPGAGFNICSSKQDRTFAEPAENSLAWTFAAPDEHSEWGITGFRILLPPALKDKALLGLASESGDLCCRLYDMRCSEVRLKVSLGEKELLLREVHHRVKNNLQLISSMLDLQMLNLKDLSIAPVLQGAINRVRTIALVHEQLYQETNFSMIRIDDYFRALVSSIVMCYQSRLPVRSEFEKDILASIDVAIPCCLILNELVANGIKHSLIAGNASELVISCRRLDESSICLEVGDVLPTESIAASAAAEFVPAGAVPAGAVLAGDALKSTGIGLQLVDALVQQLDATITRSISGGYRSSVVIPLK